MTQFLALILGRIRQPRVIAEVIGGILLGPSVMGHIPGFQASIFPDASIPGLTLTSTIGLIMFLFLVGLEIDTKVIKRNIVSATSISVAGLFLPLGLGAALGVGIYREFVSSSVNFGYFLLFTAVAIGITAFPVLCRILTSLKLLDTTVGVVTLAAGVGNDVVGWILLALTVALVNASTGLTALYVLLVCVGYIIFLIFPVKWAYVWIARWTGSLEQGVPTSGMMALTLVIVFVSAWFTDIIGIHAIFGGFLAGLIIPHENGYAIALVERLEDLVSIIFLPITWGYTIIICLVAFFSKFTACFATAYVTGFNWRESGAIGSLMSCKGLVELIVLNIGLQAGILDTRTFSMFVVHAVILTFITTPFTLLFYPEKYRTHAGKERHHHNTEGGTAPRPPSDEESKTRFALVLDKIDQLPAAMTICQLLQPRVAFPSTLTLAATDTKSTSGERPAEKASVEAPAGLGRTTSTPAAATVPAGSPITINALRLIELTNRTSAVFKSQAVEALAYTDPVASVFRTFGFLNRMRVSCALSVVEQHEFPAAIARHVAESESQVVVLPWSRGSGGGGPAPGTEDEASASASVTGRATGALNPFDGVFHRTTKYDQTSSAMYSELIRRVFATSPSHVALFVDRGLSAPYAYPSPSPSPYGAPQTQSQCDQRLFLPFFGGPDDRLALEFLVQICRNNVGVEGTVVRIQKMDESELSRRVSSVSVDEKAPESAVAAVAQVSGTGMLAPPTNVVLHQTIASPDTIYPQDSAQTRLASDTVDNLAWEQYASSAAAHPSQAIEFTTISSSKPLHTIIDLVGRLTTTTTTTTTAAVTTGSESSASNPVRITGAGTSNGNVMVVLGRSRRMAVESHSAELEQVIAEASSGSGAGAGAGAGAGISSMVRKTLGDVGAALVASGVGVSLVVMQARPGASMA
ncbi:hypothetical protein H0H92_010493 [Tricholoma furcatifolium]|nr:hypothetical protein H0H92_010493 [Tricholoma furcatifolium]